MFEKKDLINQNTGESYTKYLYKFDDTDPIVGILFGHFAPFTGPNGHGRMVTALKNIGAESFLIATPDNNKPFDDEREMFNSHQRAEIIQAYLDSEGLDGEAIAYKMKRGGAKSQMGPLVALAAEKFGLNIRPVFCFGPDREDLAADVCNKFGEITDPTHCEYIVDYERGTSGTKVRQLIKANDVDGIVSETGYKPEVAEKLIKLRMENKGMDEFKEAYDYKFTKPEREIILSQSNIYRYTRITWDFIDAIRLPEEAKAEFKAFEEKYGRLPQIGFSRNQGVYSPEVQKTVSMFDKNGNKTSTDKVQFSEETLQTLTDCFTDALKTAREEDEVYENSAMGVVSEVADWCKENKLAVGSITLGVILLAGASVGVAKYFESTKEIREAVNFYVEQNEWDYDIDKGRNEYYTYSTYDYNSKRMKHHTGSRYINGNLDEFRAIIKDVAKASKKNNSMFKKELYRYADKYGYEILGEKDGVVTIKYHSPARNGTKTVEIDTNVYQTFGDATFSFSESRMKEWEYIYGSTNPKAMTSVNVKFSDRDDANEFKDEMKDKFNIPKDLPKYRVVPGTTESGNSVFVESFKKTYNESKLDESKESVIGLALLIAAGVGLMKCANNKHIKKLEDAGAYEDYVKYNGSYDFDNGFNEKKVFAYIAECCNKGMTVEEACAAYNDIPSLKRVAQILNVKDLGDTYRVFYRARSGKYWENADITFPKSLENFESSSEGMEIDDVTFSFEESYKNIYNESSTLLPLYHPTEEIEEIVEAVKDEYEAETNYRYDPSLYHFEGGDVYIVFTTLDYRKSQELLAPICDSLTGKFDVELSASTCQYGGCIVVSPKKPDPYEDYFYEIYNGPSEVEE